MENNQSNKQGNRNRNRNRNNRPQQPQRKRRVSVDRDTEVVIVSNTIGRFFYQNPRMSMVIDLHKIGDEEYVTVQDLRTILNSNRRVLEGFQILITEVLDSEYSLDDVLLFLGLDKKYDEFYSLTRKSKESSIEVSDIKKFIVDSPFNAFEKSMETMDVNLRSRVIENAVTLFKLKEFPDYNKMQIIQKYVGEDLFDDAKETEVDEGVYI